MLQECKIQLSCPLATSWLHSTPVCIQPISKSADVLWCHPLQVEKQLQGWLAPSNQSIFCHYNVCQNMTTTRFWSCELPHLVKVWETSKSLNSYSTSGKLSKFTKNWEKTSLISYPSLYILVDAQDVLNLECNSAAEKDSKEGCLRSLSHTCKKPTSRSPNHKQQSLWKPVPMYFRQKKTQDLDHRSILPISRRRGKMNHRSTSSSLLIQQKDYRFR